MLEDESTYLNLSTRWVLFFYSPRTTALNDTHLGL